MELMKAWIEHLFPKKNKNQSEIYIFKEKDMLYVVIVTLFITSNEQYLLKNEKRTSSKLLKSKNLLTQEIINLNDALFSSSNICGCLLMNKNNYVWKG